MQKVDFSLILACYNESTTFEKTEIKTKTEANLELLRTDLSAQYEIGTASATLPSASPYDAVVTIGKK